MKMSLSCDRILGASVGCIRCSERQSEKTVEEVTREIFWKGEILT